MVAPEKNDGGGLVLPKCQQCAVSKNFNGQYLSYWLKKLTEKGHGYYESADSAEKFLCQWGGGDSFGSAILVCNF